MTFGISAIVTGAASGLGRATAAKLASRGAGVVIFDLPNSDGASVASELGGKVLFCPGDVTNPQDAQNAAEMAMKEFGSLQGKKVEQYDSYGMTHGNRTRTAGWIAEIPLHCISAFRMGPATSGRRLSDIESVLFGVTKSLIRRFGSPSTMKIYQSIGLFDLN